jgi:ABC-type molybdate transport system substrate-binding protein
MGLFEICISCNAPIPKKMNIKIIACLIVFSVVAACAGSAEITHSWKADTPAFPQSQKILVLAPGSDVNRDLLGYLEKHFTDELCSRNYEAFFSADFFASGIFENLQSRKCLLN